jgi:hypothetical protein
MDEGPRHAVARPPTPTETAPLVKRIVELANGADSEMDR